MRWRAEHRVDIFRSGDIGTDGPPWWWDAFSAAYDGARRPNDQHESAGVLVVVDPLLRAASHRIGEMLQVSRSGTFPVGEEDRNALLLSLQAQLRQSLCDSLANTFALELAVAGRRGLLIGKNGKERFAFFRANLGDAQFARSLLEQYPVLVRRIVTMIHAWETATVELLLRLGRSRQTLVSLFFSADDPGPLVSAEATSETYGGQAVCILRFKSNRRLVYKPRSVAMEAGFFRLLRWLNANGLDPDLKEVSVLDEGHCGWMEFVYDEPCTSEQDVQRYFVRQGAQMALGYILGGTDFTFANVISNGEYPVFIDLEMLFQTPLLPDSLTGTAASASYASQTSVMGTGLLPEPVSLAGDHHAIDVSGLGNREGQLTPFHMPLWRGEGTDRMRLVHARVPMEGGSSLPTYEGTRVEAGKYVGQLNNGFGRMYDFLQKRKAELMANDSPLAAFFGKPVRVTFRSSAWYRQLLAASYHPRYLTDALTCEAFLHNRMRSAFSNASWLSLIEDVEVGSVIIGDIPYFHCCVGDRAVFAGSKRTTLELSRDGWTDCVERIRSMSEPDKVRQIAIIRAAMSAAASSCGTSPGSF
jgi:type 2 lantibiotic biosynthesis protein LanM